MLEKEEVKKLEYPYIPASWLSLKVGEWEEGKKRTPVGWMSELELENTGMCLQPIEDIGKADKSLPVMAMMDRPSSGTGSSVTINNGFRIWERARRRFLKEGL